MPFLDELGIKQSTPVLSPAPGLDGKPASNRLRAIQAPTLPASSGWQEQPRIFNSQTKPSFFKGKPSCLPQEDQNANRSPTQVEPGSSDRRTTLSPNRGPRDAQVKEFAACSRLHGPPSETESGTFPDQNNNRNMLPTKEACYGCSQELCHFRPVSWRGSLC